MNSSEEKPDLSIVLEELSDIEASIQVISSSATKTVDALSEMPLISEKQLKALTEQYLSHVRIVQEKLKEHALILDIKRADTDEALVAKALSVKSAEFEKQFALLEDA